jgi:hypothetical protein
LKTDIDHKLDSLLADWHKYAIRYRLSRGYAGTDATCKDYRAPGHYDWQNGATEAKSERIDMETMDDAMGNVPNHPHRWRTCLEFQARNLATGFSVWSSPVLPKRRDELEVLQLEARNRLLQQLRRLGVM